VFTSLDQTLIIKQGASQHPPGNCPAPVNTHGQGVVKIVLVGDIGFAAETAVPGSLELRVCGEDPFIVPIPHHLKIKDLNHPDDTADCPDGCTCNPDQHSDGIDDLEMKFRQSEFLTILGLLGDEVATVELTGVLADGTAFCARDCVIIVSPLGDTNITIGTNAGETLMEMAPFDWNFDADGFTNFSRLYSEGTMVSVTAPLRSNGQPFLRWRIDGVEQPFGQRTIEIITTKGHIAFEAFYRRSSTGPDDHPTEDGGDME
jgi:hypothetical protein